VKWFKVGSRGGEVPKVGLWVAGHPVAGRQKAAALRFAEGAFRRGPHLIRQGIWIIEAEIETDVYATDLKPDDPNLCYLAHDLAKWGNKNNMTEKDHHNIDLLKIKVDSKRVLKSISITKSKPGYLVFWAAAGEKAI